MKLFPDRKPKILVVDDVPLNVELLRTYLNTAGYLVFEAGNGEKALEMVAQKKPDLLLLDIMMPKMNGFEVCKRLKSDPKTRFIPIVMVTALQSVEDKVQGIEAGADDFITKPFNKMELLARVRSLLRIKFLYDELVKKIYQLDQAKKRLQQLAITDGLTGLYNYRFFKEQLLHEINRAARHNLSLSLVMLDIDNFKIYNDANGHPAGDEVLRRIAKLLQNNIRKIDIAARYGGEEFVIILPEASPESARVVTEKIRRLVEEEPIPFENKQPNGKLTVSLGLATYPTEAEDGKQLVSTADQRLYKAKQSGRNQVVFA
ncbi:MAG TPA: diguanylate cyclase [Bacteroidetes bacterium]|nr:diguanylate cyclase [Bacteroidota bacterium]